MIEGMLRVAAVSPEVALADVATNATRIAQAIEREYASGAQLIVFPELALTGYTCGDLFHNKTLLDDAVKYLPAVAEATANKDVVAVVGMPVKCRDTLYNCAVVLHDGAPVLVVPKTYIPNYNEFYEYRWFAIPPEFDHKIKLGKWDDVTMSRNTIISTPQFTLGIEICEDLWTAIPPSSHLALAGADVIVNLSASNDLIGKRDYLKSLILQQSARCTCAYVYASAGWGESSTDLVFDGKCFIAENGVMLAETSRWNLGKVSAIADVDIEAIGRDRMHNRSWSQSASTARNDIKEITIDDFNPTKANDSLRHIDKRPFVPATDYKLSERCEEIINIQALGLARRLSATHCHCLVVGISGGLDSTLALLVACKAFDMLKMSRKGIIGVTMPGFGTTGRTYNNSLELMRSLGVDIREVSIAAAVNQHFKDIAHDPTVTDVTYENSQARERTQILMDIANQAGGMVLGTGDLSELALGWATYNGDHMSMYGVNAGVPKTLVRHLVKYFASQADESTRRVLADIVDTPISPELTPADENGNIAQKTEDLVGPYDLHDFFLYYTLRYGFTPQRILDMAVQAFDGEFDKATIEHWLKVFMHRFFAQQFKRSCLPDGPKVGSVCLSPRGDWRMPSDASSAAWLADLKA